MQSQWSLGNFPAPCLLKPLILCSYVIHTDIHISLVFLACSSCCVHMYTVNLKSSKQVPLKPTFHIYFSYVTIHTGSEAAEEQTLWLSLSFPIL